MKMRNLLIAFLLITVLILASAISFGDDKVALKLTLTKGKTYLIKTTTQAKIVQTEKGKDQKRSQTIAMTLSYQVQDVDASGLATVKITFTAAKYKMITSFGVIEYDSQNTKSPPPASALAFSAMVGQTLTIKLTPNGKVSSITGVDAMVDKMVKKINMGSNIGSMLKQQFGEEQIKEMIEGSLTVYPETPIGPGDTWTKKTTVSRGYPIVMDSKYQVKERKDGIITVDVTGTAVPNTTASPMDLGIAKIQYTLSGAQTGTIKIKEATGMVASRSMVQNLSGTVESIPTKEGEKSVSSPIVITNTITTELTEQ
jgi:hypothetical protein